MKPLNFNRKSWHSALYQSSYGTDELPDNICAYFWKLVFALIMLLPGFAGHIINMISWSLWKAGCYKGHNPVHAIWTAIHIPIFAVLAIFTATDKVPHMLWWGHVHPTLFNIWWTGGVVAIGGIIAILIVVGGIHLAENFRDVVRSTKGISTSPLKEGWKSFRGKYCSKITWN